MAEKEIPNTDPQPIGELLQQFASPVGIERVDGFTDEASRKAEMSDRDNRASLAELTELRADLIARRKAGELIDPEQFRHIGELLLEARAKVPHLRQDLQ